MRAKAAEEEKLIEQQMRQLRKELRERERLTRQVALEQTLVNQEESVSQQRDGGGVGREAEEFIQSERRRVSTRMELARQLEEAEVRETKENVKLLHCCFQVGLALSKSANVKSGGSEVLSLSIDL